MGISVESKRHSVSVIPGPPPSVLAEGAVSGAELGHESLRLSLLVMILPVKFGGEYRMKERMNERNTRNNASNVFGDRLCKHVSVNRSLLKHVATVLMKRN